MISLLKLVTLLLLRVDLLSAIENVSTKPIEATRTTKLVVEVSRHGARSSSKIYPFTVDPAENFT
jgi:hypothetical protein